MINSKIGAENARNLGSASLGHSRQSVKAENIIDLARQFVSRDGSLGIKTKLSDCNYNGKFNLNSLSLTTLLRNRWYVVKGNATGITVKNTNESVIDLDIVILTAREAIYVCRFIQGAGLAATSTGVEMKMDINKVYALLGHGSEDMTRQMTLELRWTITQGTLQSCEHCKTSKAKQKNVFKGSGTIKSTTAYESIYLDLSNVTIAKPDGLEFNLNQQWWKIAVDKATGKKWSNFSKMKNGMVEPMCKFMPYDWTRTERVTS